MLENFRFALRLFRKNPGYALAVVATLGVGIGANTAVFSCAERLWSQSPVFPEMGRLLAISGTVARHESGSDRQTSGVAPADFQDWRNECRSFELLAAWSGWMADLSGVDEAERVQGCLVSADFFATIGIRAEHGTTLSEDANEPGSGNQVILTRGLWQRRFGGDTNVVGRTIQISRNAYHVVGILPDAAAYPPGVELWAPLTLSASDWAERDRAYLRAVGRLKPGVTASQALAELRTVAGRLAVEYPQTHGTRGIQVRPLREELMLGTLAIIGLAAGASLFVLMLVCANVANLQLAHGLARRHELAIRAALGAGHRRLIGQLLTESGVLGLAGGMFGLLVAAWAIWLFKARLAVDFAPAAAILETATLNVKALGFAAGLSVLAGIMAGLAPALSVARPDVMNILKEGGRQATGDRRRQNLRRMLVVSEIGLALVLLTGAGIFLQAFMLSIRCEPGMELDGVVAFQAMPAGQRYADRGQVLGFKERVIEELAAIPGVAGVAVADKSPVGYSRRVVVQVDLADHHSGRIPSTCQSVGPNYFELLHIPLRAGRGIGPGDGPASQRVAVVSESLARRAFGEADPIGRRLRLTSTGEEEAWLTVVGVVGDVRPDPWGSDLKSVYLALDQGTAHTYAFLLKSTLSPETLIPPVRVRMRAVDPQVPLLGLESLRESVRRGLGAIPMLAPVVGSLGLLALGLCALGIYGVVAQNVLSRTAEMGIRLAMGATPGEVFRLILRGGLRLTGWGIGIGLPVGLGLSWALASQIFEVASMLRLQLQLLGAVVLAIGIMSLAACWIPARRAMRVDPMSALHSE